MARNVDLETKVIKKFIDKSKQDRFIQFISSVNNRHKFIEELAHFNHFKWNLFEAVVGNEEHIISTTLQKYKVPGDICYAISEDPELDGQLLYTSQALKEIVGHGNGTILVFGNADFIFYEGEGMKSRYISKLI